MQKVYVARVVMMAAMTLAWTTGALARAVDADAAPESKRLARAKDLIADEQWPRAIDELRAAVADTKEPRRDEALYWLAHSLNQSGDQGSAVETIARLETDFPSSMWVKPARSLRVEIAVRLNRVDVLWRMAQPPAQPVMPVKVPAPVKAPPPVSPRAPKSEKPPAPPKMWYTDEVPPDPDLQVQALGALLKTDGERVVPMLKQIAFESENPGPAMRAVFMLAQSSLPEARATVVKIAETGPEPVRVAAVRDLGRFGGPEAPKELLSLYPTAIEPVKYQIVKVLGERSDMLALMRIVESEKDGTLRYSAIAGLGQAGGGAQLARMYKSASLKGKRPIIIGLFSARADGELIRIAETEQDAALRQEALERLRLLGTPKAKEYLQKVSEKR
jgi:HEAT repeats